MGTPGLEMWRTEEFEKEASLAFLESDHSDASQHHEIREVVFLFEGGQPVSYSVLEGPRLGRWTVDLRGIVGRYCHDTGRNPEQLDFFTKDGKPIDLSVRIVNDAFSEEGGGIGKMTE